MKRLLCSTAIAVALGLAPAAAQQAKIDALSAERASPAMQVSQQDRDFVAEATTDGRAEVSMGRMAIQNAGSDKVRAFGLKMVEDHGKANDRLEGIAERKSIEIPAQSVSGANDELKGLKDTSFDRQYADAMVRKHKQAIGLFERQAKESQDAELRKFAESTLPLLRGHLKLAGELSRGMRPIAGATDSSSGEQSETMRASAPVRNVSVDQRLAAMTPEDIVGKDLLNAAGESVGEIEDVVVGADRAIQVVVGVGGFLGFGEKDVLVPLADLSVGTDDVILMADSSLDSLKSRPKYEKEGYTVLRPDRPLVQRSTG